MDGAAQRDVHQGPAHQVQVGRVHAEAVRAGQVHVGVAGELELDALSAEVRVLGEGRAHGRGNFSGPAHDHFVEGGEDGRHHVGDLVI